MGEKNLSNGFNENFEILISGLSDDLKRQDERLDSLSSALKTLCTRIENISRPLEEKLSEGFKNVQQTLDRKILVPEGGNKPVDISAIEKVLRNGITELKYTLSEVERPVTKKLNVRLFPEQNQERFYKIVYGGLFVTILILFFLRYTYNYVTRQREINRQIELEARKNDPVIKAWDYLYSQKNKSLHKLMDSAMIKTATNKK